MNNPRKSKLALKCVNRICIAALILMIVPSVVEAQFDYTTENGGITITRYTGPGGVVTIPDTIDNLPVTVVGERSFDYSSVTSVAIPNSVTAIGGDAFAFCGSLTNITIGSSVVSIADAFFGSCLSAIKVDPLNSFYSSVDGVLFDKSLTALIRCPGGKAGSYTIPGSVTTIGAEAFQECNMLTSVAIPDSVTNIGDSAFSNVSVYGQSSLTNVTIPNSVTAVGVSAFQGAGLTSVTIPESVTSIGEQAFAYCGNLSAIVVDSLNRSYTSLDGVLFNKDQTTLIQCPEGRAGNYTITNSIRSIGTTAFVWCTALTSITVPSSATNIGDFALSYCDNLTAIYFQGNAPSLGNDVFSIFSFGSAIVYYLPGTTGWGAMYGGLPTVLWRPQAVTEEASFGVRTNRFGFTINGANGLSVVVEAATNLVNPVWVPLTTNTLTSGSAYFVDPDWAKYSARFYRVRSP